MQSNSKDPAIKVTKIKNRWHARLWLDKKLIDEMACEDRMDIGWICREMLRWYDKLGGSSIYAKLARKRHNLTPTPIGKVWYLKNKI